MNDAVLFTGLFGIVCCLMATFILYHIYRGVHDSLVNADIGAVYNFRYFQPVTGDYQRFLAKVLNVRKLSKAEIERLNWSSDYRNGDKNFQRSNTLVTCQMGNGEVRQFYAERSDMCRRPMIAGLLFKAGVAHLF